jgi:homoserine kinase
MGMAVDIWTEVTVKRAATFDFTCEGEGSDVLPLDETNLIYIGCKKAFEAADKPMPTLQFHSINRIPFARGLGSSSAAIVAGLIAGLVLSGHELPVWGHEALLQLACEIEGHPDNAAPAIYGGVQIGVDISRDDASTRWLSCRIRYPTDLQCVLFIPDETGETKEARAILPDKIDRKDAIFNLGRLALLIEALNTSNFNNLQYATQDRLHQPVRGEHQFTHLFPLIDAAIAAGAHGCYLSGAGPTVCAITRCVGL